MRPYQIFAAMEADQAERFFHAMQEGAGVMYAQLVHAAAAAMKSRPGYVNKLPAAKRAAAMRRALARVGANPLAEEMLAVYFLECRSELLEEWLDAVGLEHDKGTLKEDTPAQPDGQKLDACIDRFLAKEDDPDRLLLLRAFAAQSAIEWPALDARLAASND